MPQYILKWKESDGSGTDTEFAPRKEIFEADDDKAAEHYMNTVRLAAQHIWHFTRKDFSFELVRPQSS